MGWIRRLRNTILRRDPGTEFDEEAQFHFEARVDEYIQQGLSRDEARQAAARRLGNLTLARERTRDADTLAWIADFASDLRHAARTLRKRPGFAIVAMVTLGLGVGLTTAIFAFADALILRPPDLPAANTLIRIFSRTKDVPLGRTSYPDYLEFRRRATTLSEVAAGYFKPLPVSRDRRDAPQVVGGAIVSGNYLKVLGLMPIAGRALTEDDDRAAASPVMVISEELWDRLFHDDPATLGTTLRIGNRPFTVVGIVAKEAATPELLASRPDVYVPLAWVNDVVSSFPADLKDDRANAWLTVVGRLRPGVTASAANAEVAAIARTLEETFPKTNEGRSAVALTETAARAAANPDRQQSATLLLGIAALLLLIACANVAALLVSQATARTKEIAVRLALGASRGRLVRLLLTESLLLAIGGAACGLLLAYAGVRYLSIIVRSILSAYDVPPVVFDLRFDGRVLLFALLVSLSTVVVFGLLPALRSTRIDLVSRLKAITGATGRPGRITMRGALVGAQAMLSVVALAVAGLSIRQFLEVRRVDPGFRADHVLLVTFDPSAVGDDQDQARQFYSRIVERTRALPGVETAGLAQDIPIVLGYRWTAVAVDGFEPPAGEDTVSIRSFVVDPGYWAAMRTPLVRGRAFTDQDTADSPLVAVVNETMAREFWPDRNAIGSFVRLGRPGDRLAQVVGIARDGRYSNIAEAAQPAIFLPFSQKTGTAMGMTMVVRTVADPTGVALPIRAAVHDLDPAMPAFNIRTLDEMYDNVALLQQALVAQILTTIGLLALLLTIVGLYGVIARLTALRTREIGIRMALGANRSRILLMVIRQAASMVGLGLLLGLGGAYLLTPAFAVAFSFAAHDVVVLSAVAITVATTALVASWIPARRASLVDPMVALRDE